MSPILSLISLSLSAHHASSFQKLPASIYKTLSVHETVSSLSPTSNQLTPVLACDVFIQGPNKIWCEVERLPSNEKIHLYQSNGKTEYDFFFPDAKRKNGCYTEGDFAPIGTPTNYVGRNFGHIDLILSGTPLKPPGAEVTTAIGDLDGKPMDVFTRIYDGTRTTDYVDRQTHLPYREIYDTQKDGQWIARSQIDFTDWKFNQPIDAQLFVLKEPKNAEYLGKQIMPRVSSGPLLAVGTMAPDFVAQGTDGKQVRLSSLRGKIVVLDFWASWCAPCQASMPHLEKVYRAAKDQDVVVLAVDSADDQKAYDGWVKKNYGQKYHFPVAYDVKTGTKQDIQVRLFHVEGIPTQFVIDKAGMITAVNVGYDSADHRLEDALSKLGVTVPSESAGK